MERITNISSFEELAKFLSNIDTTSEYYPISFIGDFTALIHIYGKTWEKRIDKRTAKYIISIQ